MAFTAAAAPAPTRRRGQPAPSRQHPAPSSDPEREPWLAPQGEEEDSGAGQQQMRGCYRCVSGLMTGETTGMLAIGWATFDNVIGDAGGPSSSNQPTPPDARRQTPDVEPAGAHVEPTRCGRIEQACSQCRPGLGAGKLGNVRNAMHLCSQDEAMARCEDANSCTTCVP